jgi:hypothetical protein
MTTAQVKALLQQSGARQIKKTKQGALVYKNMAGVYLVVAKNPNGTFNVRTVDACPC